MSKHTKGPWHTDGGTNSKGDLFIWKKGEYYGGHAIATVHGEIQEGSQANAYLIAAAPDLLKACKLLQAVLTGYHLRDIKKRFSLCAADAKAGKAIAKAEDIEL